MNTTESNKLIAEFMGFITTINKTKEYVEYSAHGFKGLEFYTHINNGYRQGSWVRQINSNELGMKFHESWDWLMPVVNECRYKIIQVIDNGKITKDVLEMDLIINSCMNDRVIRITKVYSSAVAFIEWYNSQNK